jgi:hypothetical protein
MWHGMFAYIGIEYGYKPGFANASYKDKFGVWPAWGVNPDPIPPSAEVRSWVRSRRIAFAKAKAKEAQP